MIAEFEIKAVYESFKYEIQHLKVIPMVPVIG